MKLTPKQKKWIKAIAILVGIRLVVGLLLYYIIEYRFKEIIKAIVHHESAGQYKFDAEDVDFSIWNKNIRLKGASLVAADTTKAVTQYRVKIPEVYLGISSWKELIFHRQVYVDSLSILLPDVSTFVKSKAARKPGVSMQTSEILNVLQRTMKNLHVRRFNLHNGSFSYNASPAPPFQSSRIDFDATNFGQSDTTANRFLFADDINLTITDQRWLMSGGLQEIRFKKLHFSGKDQFFQADSCTIVTAPAPGKTGVTLSVDRLFFKGHELSAIYERDELLLDTIICYHPVVTLAPRKKQRHHVSTDTVSLVKQSLSQVFKGINLKYVDIRDGQIKLSYDDEGEGSYATERTNLKIYNLKVQHDTEPHITTDSIDLRLKGISFYTPDSLYKMTIDEFSLVKHDIVFDHAVFEPTEMNNKDKAISFTAPSLKLMNINIEDLVQRKLRADEAILNTPVIRLYATKMARRDNDTSMNIGSFFETLHAVSDLIKVHEFNINNGNIHYIPLSGSKEKATVANINASFMLNQLLASDSLVDIKQSIKKLDIDRISVDFPKLGLNAQNVRINGTEGNTFIEELELELGANIHLKGRQFYWRNLNWDVLQQDNGIVADSINIRRLSVDLGHRETKIKKKTMPLINIRKVGLQQLDFDGALPKNGQLLFDMSQLYVEGLASEGPYLKWDRARGKMANLRFSNNNVKAKADHVLLDTRNENIVSNAEVVTGDGETTIKVPLLKMKGNIRSTGANRMDIAMMQIQSPQIEMYAGAPSIKKEPQPLSPHLDIDLAKLLLTNGSFVYHGKDSLLAKAGIDLTLEQFSANKKLAHALQYKLAQLELSNISVNGRTLKGSAGQLLLALKNGVVNRDRSMITDIGGQLQQAKFGFDNGDSTVLQIAGIGAGINYPRFRFTPGRAVNWAGFLQYASLNTGPVHYYNQQSAASVGNIRWNAEAQQLRIDSIALAPHTGQDSFLATHAWQQPYLAVKAGSLSASGLLQKDSVWLARNVVAEGITLHTAKDKGKPMPPGPPKPMLTQLLRRIPVPFRVDSLLVQDALVISEETSPKTKMTSHIPVEHINLLVRNAGNNQASLHDSLVITAQLQLFNNQVKQLYYNESYADTLSGFTLHVTAAPMYLPNLSPITSPLAGIGVNKGHADTLYYQVHGNKYAAIGDMTFVYNGLRVSMLNLPDTTRRSLLTSIKNWAANIYLKGKNNKEAFIFFDRDTDKMFLNYWIKSTLRGLLASTGIKKNHKYYRRYVRANESYKVPKKDR